MNVFKRALRAVRKAFINRKQRALRAQQGSRRVRARFKARRRHIKISRAYMGAVLANKTKTQLAHWRWKRGLAP